MKKEIPIKIPSGISRNGDTASSKKEESVSTARELFQWVAAIVAAVLIALAIDNFVIVNAQIPSGSMENTIMTGDRVIGNRFAYSFSDPQRFDIIIFRYPDDESQLFIKRIPEKRLRSGMERSI